MFRRMTRERYLSDDECERFMAVVRNRHHVHQPRDHALFALLMNTGVRPSEALSLTLADMHVYSRPAWFRLTRMKKRKQNPEWEEFRISDQLAEVLASHVGAIAGDGCARVFRMHRRGLQRLFKAYAARAGIDQHHHLYDLRHTAATRLYLATRDIAMVQALLGHENADISCIYAHVPKHLLIETVNSMKVHV